jgi:Protein of unknown function (DUF2924)
MSGDYKALVSQDLSALSIEELRMKWRQHLTEPMPDHLPKSLLARLLSHNLQVEQHGGLPKKAAAYLKVIETDLREGREPATPYVASSQLKLGTQLVREHAGVLHRVTVLEGAYAWEGKTFNSLSAVAKSITGTNWNGHRFFGLKEKEKPSVEVLP